MITLFICCFNFRLIVKYFFSGDYTWLLQVLDPQSPVLFLDTDCLPAPEVRNGRNVLNKIEADLVATLAHGLIKCGLGSNDIGVISPYKQQLKAIRKCLNADHVIEKLVEQIYS